MMIPDWMVDRKGANGDMDHSALSAIETVFRDNQKLSVRVGQPARSNPVGEWDEAATLYQVINALPDTFWVEDWLAGTIIFYNTRADLNLGISHFPENSFSLPYLANHIHPADRPKFQTIFQQINDPECSHTQSFEVRVLFKDGSWRHCRCSITVISTTSNGRPVQVLWLLKDHTEQRHYEEGLKSKSYRDSLTGLFNRTYFDEQVGHWNLEMFFPVAIIVMDINGLKNTNDLYGHIAGDRLLQTVGQMLRSTFRDEDFVARIGGDEFAILLPGADSAAACLTVQRIRKVLRQYNQLNAERPIVMSIGAAIRDENELLLTTFQRADERMYRQKRAQKAAHDRLRPECVE